MPKIGQDDAVTQQVTGSTFQFSMVQVDKLTSDRYCAATIVIDGSGSMEGEEANVQALLIKVLHRLRGRGNPMADNTLLRVVVFSGAISGHVKEVHGFKLLSDIKDDDYVGILQPGGMTPLLDVTYSAVQATVDLATTLSQKGYTINGIVVILTDGAENISKMGPQSVKDATYRATHTSEVLESFRPILIGFKVPTGSTTSRDLETFRTEAGFDQYQPWDADDRAVGKLVDFVSVSVSSQSKALGTGSPSKAVDPNTLTV